MEAPEEDEPKDRKFGKPQRSRLIKGSGGFGLISLAVIHAFHCFLNRSFWLPSVCFTFAVTSWIESQYELRTDDDIPLLGDERFSDAAVVFSGITMDMDKLRRPSAKCNAGSRTSLVELKAVLYLKLFGLQGIKLTSSETIMR